ncbi:ATP-binding cassette domain-containing protein [Aggregatibacter kilianii]|uniref:ATP-binding cassette domain-containing protein n=1 Tax=Aggregatibacter kilianii TaxID=2025884 RepID=UPI0019550745|nr:ATP-binding cassette domain-containing protein [Aggregatibacter kilianii]
MLSLRQVRYQIFNDVIVDNFNFDLAAGEVKTLFGPSGCGKTTVLRLISGLAKPKCGQISNRFRKVGFMFQENRLLNNLNALENIRIFMTQPDNRRIFNLAADIGLQPDDLKKYPIELSGGMAKRIALLRLFLSDCDLALLDEPFVGLDRDLRNNLTAILANRISEQGLACLLVTHDRFEAARLSHEILLLSTKGMHIKQSIFLPEPLNQRDNRYEEEVVATRFNGVVYYD